MQLQAMSAKRQWNKTTSAVRNSGLTSPGRFVQVCLPVRLLRSNDDSSDDHTDQQPLRLAMSLSIASRFILVQQPCAHSQKQFLQHGQT